jgi:hypothetical protein
MTSYPWHHHTRVIISLTSLISLHSPHTQSHSLRLSCWLASPVVAKQGFCAPPRASFIWVACFNQNPKFYELWTISCQPCSLVFWIQYAGTMLFLHRSYTPVFPNSDFFEIKKSWFLGGKKQKSKISKSEFFLNIFRFFWKINNKKTVRTRFFRSWGFLCGYSFDVTMYDHSIYDVFIAFGARKYYFQSNIRFSLFF